MLPQLRELEEQFAAILVVIGVHSPKFTAEGVTANLRQAVLRHDIRHPVVSDPHHVVWDSYAVSAWPTTVLISPEGRALGAHAGEFEAAEFAPVIAQIAASFQRAGKLDCRPLSFPLEREKEPTRALDFPGKVLADLPGGRLFIADTGHHRVLVTDPRGQIQAVIGRGVDGLEDGDFDTASFHAPQGLAAAGDILYVADTENHAIRRVDLRGRRVERVAGTGRQARRPRRGGAALTTELNSPWDLALADGVLYIAMAGNHQLWALDIAAGQLRRVVGTGREALYDATLERSALAQPSGLALADGRLYFADSENSAIRVADLLQDRVETILGEGLFDFGDRDGQGSVVRLQHALGVAATPEALYVADTYNNKIKRVDPNRRRSETFLGTGDAGREDGPGDQAKLWEPGGVSHSEGQLFIADTNNHALRVADLRTRVLSTLAVR